VQTFYGQAEKLQMTVAFDCMWRFPNENPVKTTMREDRPLLDEVIKHDNFKDPDFKFQKFFSNLGYRAAWGSLHGDALWKEMYKLKEWYHMRHYLQIDKFDERISMELAIVVALLTLVPQVLLIIYNFLVLSNEQGKLQSINFVTLWDFAFILFFVFRALMMTLTFNDLYDRHSQNLSGLLEYIKLEKTTNKEGGGKTRTSSQDSLAEGEAMSFVEAANEGDASIYKDDEAVQLVETFQKALERFDAPSEFFGMKVDRKVITAFSSTALVILTPQILNIIQDVCKDF